MLALNVKITVLFPLIIENKIQIFIKTSQGDHDLENYNDLSELCARSM